MIKYEPVGELLMKNIKFNEIINKIKNIKNDDDLKDKILISIVSLILISSGYGLGRDNSAKKSKDIVNGDEVINEYLADYIAKRDALEKEIDNLQTKKEELQNVETFYVENLIVMENTNVNNESNLYILHSVSTSGIYYEYHNEFKAWYRLHPDSEEHSYDFCGKYIHFNESQPLFNYLTSEEIETIARQNGKVTTSELDEILARIRFEYQQQNSKNNYSNRLTRN